MLEGPKSTCPLVRQCVRGIQSAYALSSLGRTQSRKRRHAQLILGVFYYADHAEGPGHWVRGRRGVYKRRLNVRTMATDKCSPRERPRGRYQTHKSRHFLRFVRAQYDTVNLNLIPYLMHASAHACTLRTPWQGIYITNSSI